MNDSKKHFFKIGEMAELFDLNIRTLRYYDQIDLLKPEFIDPDSGYRYYSTAQFEPLNTIRYLRDLGMSLDDIRVFLSNRDVDAMKNMMHAQLEEVEQRQRDLSLIRRKLQMRLEQIEKAQTDPLGIVQFRWIDARRAVLLRYALAPNADLEYPIRLLARTIGVRGVFLGMVGLSIGMQRLDAGQFDNYDNIFLLLDGESVDRSAATEESETIPENMIRSGNTNRYTTESNLTTDTGMMFAAGEYAVLRFRGTHAGAAKEYQHLYDEIRRQGYEICGDSLEITLIDYGLTNDQDNFVTELQIPVKTE